ncbi:MAG: VOC family protein [Oscillospiraceae bacterium]|nr:VOC family protein [Oscillospiraceae bacterium]
MFKFNHFNFNVLDLEKSLKFYAEALDLEPTRFIEADDGSFRLVFLGDGSSDFTLELTWLKDRDKPYDLGECEYHLAFMPEDAAKARGRHEELGVICFENHDMGIYFINDPDGYWIEILPGKRPG